MGVLEGQGLYLPAVPAGDKGRNGAIMNQQRFELLEQLEKATRTGVNCVHEMNASDPYSSYIIKLEIKQRMDAAWEEILRLLGELEAVGGDSLTT